MLGLNTKGHEAFVALSAEGNCRRWKMRWMQPSTRPLPRLELATLADPTEPPGVTLKEMVTPPARLGLLDAAAS